MVSASLPDEDSDWEGQACWATWLRSSSIGSIMPPRGGLSLKVSGLPSKMTRRLRGRGDEGGTRCGRNERHRALSPFPHRIGPWPTPIQDKPHLYGLRELVDYAICSARYRDCHRSLFMVYTEIFDRKFEEVHVSYVLWRTVRYRTGVRIGTGTVPIRRMTAIINRM